MSLSFSMIAFIVYFSLLVTMTLSLMLYLHRKLDKNGWSLIKYAWAFKSIYGAIIVQFYDTGFHVNCVFARRIFFFFLFFLYFGTKKNDTKNEHFDRLILINLYKRTAKNTKQS